MGEGNNVNFALQQAKKAQR